MTDLSDKYLEHFDEAERFLAEADGQSAEAGRECLAAAGVHAALALAVAVDRLTYAIRERS
ncbi:hypothetical protein FHU36_000290 [Nonomuraea muscovyensis]|uniref:Uncharacterized protein n=1 Tax=Nonomuraea muscovyensis TaxID=1124761 RepID=A0A7X0BYE9_9ACTN|nr:hypothetical protein [Nonomuraea muscovyensis]MBB6343781.1 hypothetical protein [Nonomuraea muscovyensis]